VPEAWRLLLDLIVTLIGALLFGALMEKLRQSPIVGYLLAGVVIGPSALGLAAGHGALLTIAEIGVALLLFTIGLEFSWKRLLRMGGLALGGGSIQIVLTAAVGAAAARLFGLDWPASFMLGMILAVSSTAVVLRVLKDRGDLDSLHGRAATGVTLLQDAAMVPMMLIATLIVQPAIGDWAERFAGAVVGGAVFLAGIAIVVGMVLPRLLNAREFARNRELPILTAVVTGVGATWAAHAMGLSPSLGAFLAGMLLAESRYADQIRADVYPLKTVFVTIFFASIGTLVDLSWLRENLPLVGAATVATMTVKALIVYLAIRPFLRGAIVPSIAAGLTLSQLGELSFVLAKLAAAKGVFEPELMQLVLSVTICSLLVTPLLVAGAPRIARAIAKRLCRPRALAKSEREAQRLEGLQGHVVLAGFGAAGQAAARELHSADAKVVVLDIDQKLAALAAECGWRAQVGDATQPLNLLMASVDHAACLIVAIPDHRTARLVISQAKALNPGITAIVRCRYAIYAGELDLVGADVVVNEEIEVGEQLGREAVRFCVAREPYEPVPGTSLR
jgi:CPA2 family monovalent cation:H+ antiporter-2